MKFFLIITLTSLFLFGSVQPKQDLIITHSPLKDELLAIKEVPIGCETEIMKRYQDKEAWKAFETYKKSIKNNMTYKELKEVRNILLDNIKNEDLNKDLFYNFRGATMPIFDVVVYSSYCKSEQELLKKKLMILPYLLGGAFILLLFGILFNRPEKKDKKK